MTKSEEARKQLEQAVEELATSEGWTRYLDTRARFHNYSFGNVALIAMQRPSATQVAGYKAWQKLGRQVRKGERGIRILAPIVRKVEADDGDEQRRVVWFKTVSVFDVAQTDGEALPQPPVRLLTEGGDQSTFMALQDHAEAEGLSVTVDDAQHGENGYIDREGRRIVLSTHVFQTGTPAQRIKTLAHELAHWHDLGAEGATTDRESAEIVAEAVAYVVGAMVGLDTSDYSTGYVLTWAGGDVDKLRNLAARIDAAVTAIAPAITADVATTTDVDAESMAA